MRASGNIVDHDLEEFVIRLHAGKRHVFDVVERLRKLAHTYHDVSLGFYLHVTLLRRLEHVQPYPRGHSELGRLLQDLLIRTVHQGAKDMAGIWLENVSQESGEAASVRSLGMLAPVRDQYAFVRELWPVALDRLDELTGALREATLDKAGVDSCGDVRAKTRDKSVLATRPATRGEGTTDSS